MQTSVQRYQQAGSLNQRGKRSPALPYAIIGRPAAASTLTTFVNAVARCAVLFAKALTASDCCTSVSKGGRITIPRVAVEKNLPSVADKRHHEVVSQLNTCTAACSQTAVTHTCLLLQVALDANDTEWTFVIKSWPNGGENKRVYVMEKTGAVCGLCFAKLTLSTMPPPYARLQRGLCMYVASDMRLLTSLNCCSTIHAA